MTTHNVEVNVTANTQQAQKSLSYLQSLMGEFGKQATNRFAAMFGAAAVAKMAFDKVSQSISANIATAKQVSQMAIKFNIDPVAMHSITMAAKDAGVSVRALTMSMKQLGKYAEKAMTSKDAQANFKQLGIEANKLNEIQAAPSKFLPEIAKALMEIGDENQRSAAGATLLGRQYQMLLPLIEELGTSEEARAKFLENQNAMTEEQIAANKEIAKVQNDLSDGFDKLVAAVAPLLLWAMNFVNFLADGLGFIKGMIFESEQARKQRIAKSNATIAVKSEEFAKEVDLKYSTMPEDERKKVQDLGGGSGYVGNQLKLLEDLEKERLKTESEIGRLTDEAAAGGSYERAEAFKAAIERVKAPARAIEAQLNQDFLKKLGISSEDAQGGSAKKREAYVTARKDITSAFETGALRVLTEKGLTAGAGVLKGKAAEAEEKRMKSDLAKYHDTRRKQSALSGEIYDPLTDRSLSKAAYALEMESRGESKDSIGKKIRAFEKEEDRVKREKQTEASERKLAASERKLYVGDPSQGRYKQGLDEAEKAAEALQDTKDAQVEPLKDLNEQQGIFNDLANDLYIAQNANIYEGIENEADILRLTAQLEVEKIKLNDLQSKANDLKGQEVAAEENLKKAMEKTYREEEKRKDAVKARIKTEQDHEKQLKYKVMKAEGSSQRDIIQEQLKDEEAEYGKLLEDYSERLAELKGNQFKGNKGEDISEEERKELEGLTKELDAKKRGILDKAFEFGNQGDKGQATSMRRIGGGGMEYGGLANTAKESLEVQKKMLKELEGKNGVNLFPTLYENATGVYRDASKYGKTYADSYTGADGSPR